MSDDNEMMKIGAEENFNVEEEKLSEGVPIEKLCHYKPEAIYAWPCPCRTINGGLFMLTEEEVRCKDCSCTLKILYFDIDYDDLDYATAMKLLKRKKGERGAFTSWQYALIAEPFGGIKKPSTKQLKEINEKTFLRKQAIKILKNPNYRFGPVFTQDDVTEKIREVYGSKTPRSSNDTKLRKKLIRREKITIDELKKIIVAFGAAKYASKKDKREMTEKEILRNRLIKIIDNPNAFRKSQIFFKRKQVIAQIAKIGKERPVEPKRSNYETKLENAKKARAENAEWYQKIKAYIRETHRGEHDVAMKANARIKVQALFDDPLAVKRRQKRRKGTKKRLTTKERAASRMKINDEHDVAWMINPHILR